MALVVVLLAPLRSLPSQSCFGRAASGDRRRTVDWKRLSYALRASRYDAGFVLVTASSAVFLSVEFSILIGVPFSILMYIPRAALLHWSELVVSADRVIRDRLRGDPPCNTMAFSTWKANYFSGGPGPGPLLRAAKAANKGRER